jgi:transposase
MNEPSSSAGVRSLKIRAEDPRRARVILMLADGASYSTIEATVPCFRDYINRWRRRFLADRLEGLRPRYKGHPCGVIDRDAWRPVPE